MNKYEIMVISTIASLAGGIIASYLQEKLNKKYSITEKTNKRISLGILIFIGILFIIIIVHSLFEKGYFGE